MTTMQGIRLYIQIRRSEHISDYRIAKELGVSTPEIGRLMKHKYPGEKVARQLGLDVICHTCHRKEKKPRAKNQVSLSDYQRWWRGLPKADRDRMIQNLFELEGSHVSK